MKLSRRHAFLGVVAAALAAVPAAKVLGKLSVSKLPEFIFMYYTPTTGWVRYVVKTGEYETIFRQEVWRCTFVGPMVNVCGR